MKCFDANCSYGRVARPAPRSAATPGELLAEMDWCGIDRALVYHAGMRFASPVTWNTALAADLEGERPREPLRRRIFPAWAILPPCTGELSTPEKFVAGMRAAGIQALWAFPQEHRYRLDRATFRELFAILEQARIPLFAKQDLDHLKELLVQCPELTVVAVNQGPHSVERYLRPLLDDFPNLYLETSGLLVEGLIEEFCGRYGPERLLFGSGYPDQCLGGAYLRLAQADIGEDARAAIAGGNLDRLLAWGGKASDKPDAPDGGMRGCTVSSPLARDFVKRGRSTACPIIDMHGHWGPFAGGYLPAAREEVMVAALRRQGVRRIVCSAHDALFADPERGNAEMQAAIGRHPDLLAGYWAVNPNYPELAERAPADFEAATGFVGFKLLPDYHVCPVTSDAYRPVFEHANTYHLPVLIHTWGGSAFNSPQQVEIVAKRYPEARLLMGHSGYGDWETSVRLAREYPNVYIELTACYAAHDFAMLPGGSGTPVGLCSCLHVNGIIEYFVEQAGSEKIVFGTDLPWYSPHFAAGAVLFAHIDEQDRHNILHRNADRLLENGDRPGKGSECMP